MKIERCCGTCEMCMPNDKGDLVCAGGMQLPDGRFLYGMSIEEKEKLFPNGCDDYEIGFCAYMDEVMGEEWR